jgi:hypothetical protein
MALESVVSNGQTPTLPGDLDEAELNLFRAMRRRMADGARVEFKEDHDGNLIAVESVLHRAEDYADAGSPGKGG